MSLLTKLKRLRFKDGDILLVQHSSSNARVFKDLQEAGKSIKADVAVIFVDDVNHYIITQTVPNNTTEPTRFKLVSDDDGHEYVIPVSIVSEFYQWLENLENEDCDKYEVYRVNGHLTFTDPRQN